MQPLEKKGLQLSCALAPTTTISSFVVVASIVDLKVYNFNLARNISFSFNSDTKRRTKTKPSVVVSNHVVEGRQNLANKKSIV